MLPLGMAADGTFDLDKERERRLVERAKGGDREALGELLTRSGPVIYRTVLLPRLGSVASAEDALSETYAKVVDRIGMFTWQPSGFYPWLRTVVLNVALDMLRRRKRQVLWSSDDVARELDETAVATPLDQRLAAHRDAEAARAKLEAALSGLNPRYAKVIRLRILDEVSREDAARLLSVTEGTLDVLLHRALTSLKRELHSRESESPHEP